MSTPAGGEFDDLDTDLPETRRDRREHGGAPDRLDDDALAERTEQERVDAGVAAYDPDDVPPATDVDDEPFDVASSEEYQEEVGEIKKQMSEGEIIR